MTTLTGLVREVQLEQGIDGDSLSETVYSEAALRGLHFTEAEIRFAVRLVEEQGGTT